MWVATKPSERRALGCGDIIGGDPMGRGDLTGCGGFIGCGALACCGCIVCCGDIISCSDLAGCGGFMGRGDIMGRWGEMKRGRKTRKRGRRRRMKRDGKEASRAWGVLRVGRRWRRGASMPFGVSMPLVERVATPLAHALPNQGRLSGLLKSRSAARWLLRVVTHILSSAQCTALATTGADIHYVLGGGGFIGCGDPVGCSAKMVAPEATAAVAQRLMGCRDPTASGWRAAS